MVKLSGMLLAAVGLLSMHQAGQVEYLGDQIGLRTVKVVVPPKDPKNKSLGAANEARDKEIVLEFLAKDAAGKFRIVAVSPTDPKLAEDEAPPPVQNMMQSASDGLFQRVPTFAFLRVRVLRTDKGATFTFSTLDRKRTINQEVFIPAHGNVAHITLTARITEPNPSLRYFLNTVAFAPDGKKSDEYGGPDLTWAPAIRPGESNVIGDHFFRSPAVIAQKDRLVAILMPDLDVLKENRPLPTILDLDAANHVVAAPLLSYGFCDYKLASHVYFTNDSSMQKPVPPELKLAMDLMVLANAKPKGAVEEASKYLWQRYGKKYFDKVLPRAMPFSDYAKVCYPAAFDEHYGDKQLGWFEQTIDGRPCGGVMAGWGYDQGWVSWQSWFNNLRSGWGMHWWGHKLGNSDWVEKSNKMLNLALAAPMDRGAVPTTYMSREKKWRGSLIEPDPRCYYDLTNMAWKGLWMLKWLEFSDCPRREEVTKQCRAMADLMVSKQNPDGSIPTWLDKDLNVVPILDHSAQTALPAWFLAEMARAQSRGPLEGGIDRENLVALADVLFSKTESPKPLKERPRFRFLPWVGLSEGLGDDRADRYSMSALKAADFLLPIVDGQYYYDFETFFSCSPKQCLQRDGKVDNDAMRDPHTLQPPQNTLSMQWCAEALRAISHLQVVAAPSRGRESGAGSPHSKGSGDGGESGARSPHSQSYMAYALKALSVMEMYQCVWPISYRKVAYVYGGFGVQNSDGEYNDARQAQFGATLCDFGAELGRQDLFERGVAATRASLALINHPLHIQYGIYPNPNYPLGLEPENNGHGGTDQQNGRTGFDWGEGSGLTSMAYLLEAYGANYKANEGWAVLVDGAPPGWKPAAEVTKAVVDPAWDMRDWRMAGWTFDGSFLGWPFASSRQEFGNNGLPFIGTAETGLGGYDDKFTGTIASPVFTATKPTLKLLVGGGSGKGVYVELIDADSGKQLQVEHGKDEERMSERIWDISKYKGKKLQIRIVDQETGPWGHINVGNVRCE